jgi:hypothetical protein
MRFFHLTASGCWCQGGPAVWPEQSTYSLSFCLPG